MSCECQNLLPVYAEFYQFHQNREADGVYHYWGIVMKIYLAVIVQRKVFASRFNNSASTAEVIIQR
jgi:hypothetical protein